MSSSKLFAMMAKEIHPIAVAYGRRWEDVKKQFVKKLEGLELRRQMYLWGVFWGGQVRGNFGRNNNNNGTSDTSDDRLLN